MIIYKATNLITQEVYIGKTTKNFKKRITDHIYEAFTRKRNNKFHAALREFGRKNFDFQQVAKAVNHSQLKKLERSFMIKNHSIEYGYNTQYR